MKEPAIKISHVSKEYRLGTIGGGTLRAELQSKFARMRGKEDPNLKIGAKAHEKNERFLALDEVSLEINRGERVGIIGHNGAGKSTLLKLICRVTAPTKGDIYIKGRVTSMLEVGTGFHGELTGRENVYLNGAILGLSKSEIDEIFDKIVEFSEVGQFIDTPVKRYSSGMHVKLGFAVASHLDSEIMIMDEVLAVGDMAFQTKCINKMRKAAEDEGRTILYVSHNMRTIRQLCDRCIVLDHGKVIFDGDPDKAIEIYMPKGNESAYADVLNYENFERPDNMNDDFRIVRFEYLNKGGFEIPVGHDIHFRITVNAKKAADNVLFRIELLDKDDSPFAMATTRKHGFSLSVGENSFTGNLALNSIVPGKYKLAFLLYGVNDYGATTRYDLIYGTARFIVYGDDTINGLKWNHTWWGHYSLPEIRLVSENNDD
ncbi:MAG: ABC transporter ATP-binding protein [Clostridia bacterium]|nr:ABC transporter ATP-binding protein [Clostridia bacterium]